MLLKEFDDYKLDKTNIASYISINCSNILKVYKGLGGMALYCGMSYRMGRDRRTEDIFVGESPINRIPKDMGLTYQTLIDEKLNEYGFSALRCNSIFCTSDFKVALGYGDVYMIFPINGFKYMWCNRADDLWATFLETQDDNAREKFKDDLYDLDAVDFVSEYGFENNRNIEMAMIKHYEICIHGHYVAVKADSIFADRLLSKLMRNTRTENV